MYYAEYLPRIGIVSTVIDYKESIKDLKGITLKNDGQLHVRSENGSYDIILPVTLPFERLKVSNLNHTDNSLSISLIVQKSRLDNCMDTTEPLIQKDLLKWSCKYLYNRTPKDEYSANRFTFNCMRCNNILLDSVKYKFMDMPSEYWQELMEFWHCHKPHSDEPNKKSYNGALFAKKNEIAIGNYYLMVNIDSVDNDALVDSSCAKCGQSLGELGGSNLKLFKWNLILNYNDTRENFSQWLYVYSIIMDNINISALRKYNIKSNTSSVFLWIISVGSSISLSGSLFNNALKVLYLPNVSGKDADQENVELLDVSDDVLDSLNYELDRMHNLLPLSNRSLSIKEGHEFYDYKIAYLSPN